MTGVYLSTLMLEEIARRAEARRAEAGIPCWSRTSVLVAVRKHFCKPPPELLGQRDKKKRVRELNPERSRSTQAW